MSREILTDTLIDDQETPSDDALKLRKDEERHNATDMYLAR